MRFLNRGHRLQPSHDVLSATLREFIEKFPIYRVESTEDQILANKDKDVVKRREQICECSGFLYSLAFGMRNGSNRLFDGGKTLGTPTTAPRRHTE